MEEPYSRAPKMCTVLVKSTKMPVPYLDNEEGYLEKLIANGSGHRAPFEIR